MDILMPSETPIYVCECCGKIVRAFVYEETDVYHCPFCRFVMTKTEYSIYDDEYYNYFGINAESTEFQQNVFLEYVKGNPNFDSEKKRLRICDELAPLREYMKMLDEYEELLKR